MVYLGVPSGLCLLGTRVSVAGAGWFGRKHGGIYISISAAHSAITRYKEMGDDGWKLVGGGVGYTKSG